VVRLVPQRTEFFELYRKAGANAVAIARALVELLDRFPDTSDLSWDIKELEHEGDRLTYDIVDLLNRTFVTPFDREDMYRLASALDDICDHIDEAAGNILTYGIEEVRPKAKEQGNVVLRGDREDRGGGGPARGLQGPPGQLAALRDLEDEGDRLNREAVSELFHSNGDAISVIRWKDIHEHLEEAVDACENAADVLEAIFVKNR
jgi:uncharacterized protein Yka (UPF0111/DUF47 family)